MQDRERPSRRRVVGLIAALALSCPALDAGVLEVHFINLGHGDCTLIKTPQGKAVLVDAGLSVMTWKLERYLKRHGVTTIDLVVLTHAHPDHRGGMRGVIESFAVKEFAEPGVPAGREAIEGLRRLVMETKVVHTIARRGTTFRLDDLILEVLSPPRELVAPARSPENANSIVLRVSHEDARVLLTGDIEAETEAYLLATGDDLAADVLKVPHHGVSTGSTAAFLDAVKPRYAIITCAYYAEPSRDLYDLFEERRIAWLRNDANGTVVARLGEGLPGNVAVAYERGEESSRLKVAPDWFKLLQQVKSAPVEAKLAWKTFVHPKARALAGKIETTYKERKDEIRRACGESAARIREACESRKQKILDRLPGFLRGD